MKSYPSLSKDIERHWRSWGRAQGRGGRTAWGRLNELPAAEQLKHLVLGYQYLDHPKYGVLWHSDGELLPAGTIAIIPPRGPSLAAQRRGFLEMVRRRMQSVPLFTGFCKALPSELRGPALVKLVHAHALQSGSEGSTASLHDRAQYACALADESNPSSQRAVLRQALIDADDEALEVFLRPDCADLWSRVLPKAKISVLLLCSSQRARSVFQLFPRLQAAWEDKLVLQRVPEGHQFTHRPDWTRLVRPFLAECFRNSFQRSPGTVRFMSAVQIKSWMPVLLSEPEKCSPTLMAALNRRHWELVVIAARKKV